MSFEEPPDDGEDDDFGAFARRFENPAMRAWNVEVLLAEGYISREQAIALLEMRDP